MLEVDGQGQGFSLPSPPWTNQKTFSIIFRLKPYFLCGLSYILAWNYLFSVTQINVCFHCLCQAECRENSVLQEVVGFPVLEKADPLPHIQLPEGPCRAMHPSSTPSQGWEPCSCHPHEPVHVCTVSLQMLQTTSCHLIPAPTMLDTWGCNKKFDHHLKVQFTFEMHFHSALCTPHR